MAPSPSARPEVSVVIPTRDRRQRLLRTLEDVRRQRGPSLEVVVVDDGSRDGTATAVEQLGDERLRVVRNERSLGLAGARNAGIRAAAGEWIAFLDDDDLWAPVKLEVQLRAAAAAGASWCFSGAAYIDDDGCLLRFVEPPRPASLVADLRGHNAIPAGASNVIVRADLLAQVGLFDERLRQFADWDLWIRLAAAASAAAVTAPLLFYVHHTSNMRHTEPDALAAESRLFDAKHGLDASHGPTRFRADRWMAEAQWRTGRRMAAARTLGRLLSSGDAPANLRWLLRPWVTRDRVLRTVGALIATSARALGARAGFAVVYHALAAEPGVPGTRASPPLGTALFADQVAHLARWYRPVTASALPEAVARRRRWERIPIAITFDDDERSHLETAAPILTRLGVPATFFLTGAGISGPVSPWWERLDRALAAGMDPYDETLPPLDGVDVAWAAGPVDFVAESIRALPPVERDRLAERLLEHAGPDPDTAGLRAAQVRELRDAGFEIGFHTRRHDSLSDLDDDALAAALTEGRQELAAAAGSDPDVIAYPHGRADERVARAVRAAGFRTGYVTRRGLVTPEVTRELLPRYAPSYESVGWLSIALAAGLWRGAFARARSA
jgi:peptidoglycan/xylan/chitin deacetylase (PgdA/CDA1 family)